MHDALVIALSSPVLVGIYKNGELIEEIESEAMSSDALPEIFDALLKKYQFSHLIYAQGPGSFMGIKVTYLFLQTLSIVKKIPLLARDAFFFNENHPIKAVGKLYFVKNRDTITMEPIENPVLKRFKLPRMIRIDDFTPHNAPYYGIDAVG